MNVWLICDFLRQRELYTHNRVFTCIHLISRVLLHCNTVTGHAPYSYKLLIRLRLCLGLGWCHLPIGWVRFQLDILKMGMYTFQLHFDIII